MARIEWVKLRLQNWALWKARQSGGGLGFAKQSVLLSERVDRYRESVIPVDETDASTTDQAVESLRKSQHRLYQVLQEHYVRGRGVLDISRALSVSSDSVHLYLGQADVHLRNWLTADQDRKAQARREADAVQRAHAAARRTLSV